jgi:hypothetical protein
LFALACNSSSDVTGRVNALEANVSTLQQTVSTFPAVQDQAAQIATLTQQLAVAQAALAAQADALAKLQDMLTVLSRDANGDIVIAGANLRVVDGCTESQEGSHAESHCDGKGNVFIGPGYDAAATLPRCSAGPRQGVVCGGDADCSGSTCAAAPGPVSTARESLILGWQTAAMGRWVLMAGQSNIARGDASVTFGLGNVASDYASVLGGQVNTATGYGTSILGDKGKTTATSFSTLPATP